MANVTESLFGITPEALQAQRDAALQEQAYKFAQLSPMQAAQAGFYTAGNRLGGAAGGLLGAEDPELKLVKQRQELLKGADIQSIEGLKQLSQRLYAAGDYAGAQQAFAQAQSIGLAQAELMSKAATANKANAETQNLYDTRAAKNARVQQLKDAGLSDAEAAGIASSDTAYAKFVETKKIATPPDYAVQGQALGYGAKPFLSDYTPEQVKEMEKGVFSHKAGIAAAGRATTINQQESAFSKKLGELQATDLTDARTQAVSSAKAINTLADMEKNQNLYGGPLANTTVTGAQFLQSLNLLSPEQTKKLADSEIYRKDASKLVLADLGGKLGAQISDADRKFIEGIVPQLQNSPDARQRLIAKLKEIHNSNVQNYRDMQAHANQYGNLNKFDPTKLYGYKGSSSTTPPAAGTKENPIKL